MQSIQNEMSKINSKNYERELRKEYALAKNNLDFQDLLIKLKIKDEIAMHYTSKLENTILELNNCKTCRSLLECKNKVSGFVDYPFYIEELTLRFHLYSKQNSFVLQYHQGGLNHFF